MKKLPEGEAKRRHEARNKAKNEKRKADLIAYKLEHGIVSPVTVDRKERMRLYSQRKRVEAKLLKPHKPEKVPKPIKQGIIKPKIPTKMQQPLKQVPVKVFHKPDHFKQPVKVKIKNSDEGKIKFRIDSRTEVMIYPNQDRDEVRARYLNR